jgi:hypothetical protein
MSYGVIPQQKVTCENRIRPRFTLSYHPYARGALTGIGAPAYDLVTMSFYRSQMSPNEAAKIYRDKADAYLEMTGYVRDERRRRILHELFEENEAKAELLERMMLSHEGFGAFRIRRRMN